jgi:hypothetical protein
MSSAISFKPTATQSYYALVETVANLGDEKSQTAISRKGRSVRVSDSED